MEPHAAKVAYGCWKHFMINQKHFAYVRINIPASQAKWALEMTVQWFAC